MLFNRVRVDYIDPDGDPAYEIYELNEDAPCKLISVNAYTLSTQIAISAQPQDASEPVGDTASFSVTATGAGSLSYQWQVKYAGSAVWASIDGAYTSSYTTGELAAENDGDSYRVMIVDGNGEVLYSDAADITITESVGG